MAICVLFSAGGAILHGDCSGGIVSQNDHSEMCITVFKEAVSDMVLQGCCFTRLVTVS